jgi:copper resistance protein C
MTASFAAGEHVRQKGASMAARRITSIIAVFLVAALLTVGLSAHLRVLKTLPADGSKVTEPPARVQVWFDQEPSPRLSRLEMQGPGGEVTLGTTEVGDDRSISAAVTGALPPGSYEVTWRTAGDDGHVQRGTFGFVLQAMP